MAFAAVVPMWMSIAGAAISAYGIYQQGQAQKKSAEFNAMVAQQNATIARQRAQLQAKQQDRLNRLRLGSIRASQGASGGAQGEGSILDILGDVGHQGELQKQEILYDGELKALGYKNQSQLSTMAASAAGKQATIGAGSALLGGASDTYDTLGRSGTLRRG